MVLSILELTNAARVAAASGNKIIVGESLSAIESRLRSSPGRRLDDEFESLHGRKAVDASFNLALAGVSTPWVYETLSAREKTSACSRASYFDTFSALVAIFAEAEREVERWGRRKSCSSMTLAQLAERTAASGFVGPLPLFDLLGQILTERGEPAYESIARALVTGEYSLSVSSPAARWVNRASAKQSKIASSSADGYADAADWGFSRAGGRGGAMSDDEAVAAAVAAGLFADGHRPLTVDLGCGYGVGPLVFARSATHENVLGCDLSAGGTAYARGLASRWDLSSRCSFVRDQMPHAAHPLP